MKNKREHLPDWVFALLVSLTVTFLIIATIVAGVETIKMIGWGR